MRAKIKDAEQAWGLFEKLAIRRNIPNYLKDELKKAFYCGLAMAITILRDNIDEEKTDEENNKVFETFEKDVDSFFKILNEQTVKKHNRH